MTQENPSDGVALDKAYAVCRSIARREAKNFYYAFIALPTQRRNAICAVYAFMRRADDLADDESFSTAVRRVHLDEWLGKWRSVCEGAATDDPVFLAVRDATQRFSIPLSLLNELVAGVTMDLDRAETGAPDTYATFNDLYRYCYLVASVVGLVCIRIFGYKDERAEKFAEETGIAFQLTNILRDVKEDAAMSRVYLPEEDMQRFGVSADELASGVPLEKLRPLLAFEAARAREFYVSAERLLPLIEEVSQPALWAMVEIYRGILDRIELKLYDVYTERVRLSVSDKLKILVKGFWKRLL